MGEKMCLCENCLAVQPAIPGDTHCVSGTDAESILDEGGYVVGYKSVQVPVPCGNFIEITALLADRETLRMVDEIKAYCVKQGVGKAMEFRFRVTCLPNGYDYAEIVNERDELCMGVQPERTHTAAIRALYKKVVEK